MIHLRSNISIAEGTDPVIIIKTYISNLMLTDTLLEYVTLFKVKRLDNQII